MELLIWTIITLLWGFAIGGMAKRRNRSPWAWGIAGVLTIPLIVTIILAICGKHEQKHNEIEVTL